MVKILRVTIISIALMIFFLPTLVIAQDIVAVRDISPALADRGGIINVTISFTAPQGLTRVELFEKITDGWTVTDMSGTPPPSAAKFDSNLSSIEMGWSSIPSGNVSVTYKLKIPENAVYANDYVISGYLINETNSIGGDFQVVVSSQKDTMPPIIHSVFVNNTGSDVYVIANVTDDIMVMSVTANKIGLRHLAGDNWEGRIPLEAGTNIPVVIVAKDAVGKIVTDSSQKYSSTVQAGVTQTSRPSGNPAPSGGTYAPSKTTTIPPGVTPSDTEPDVTDTSEPTPEVTISPTPARATPGFGLAFAIVGLVAVAYRIRKGS